MDKVKSLCVCPCGGQGLGLSPLGAGRKAQDNALFPAGRDPAIQENISTFCKQRPGTGLAPPAAASAAVIMRTAAGLVVLTEQN